MEEKNSVLIVDDDITLLKMAEQMLVSQYCVSIAKSGEQAIGLLARGFCPDIILLDLDMPDMDGYQTLEKLRAIPEICEVPVLILTGLNQRKEELRSLSSGAEDFITKPFDLDVLLARIAIHIQNGDRRRRLSRLNRPDIAIVLDEAKFQKIAADLTVTEAKIARLIALGYPYREISADLHYSYPYVKKVAHSIFEKLGINSRNELKNMCKLS